MQNYSQDKLTNHVEFLARREQYVRTIVGAMLPFIALPLILLRTEIQVALQTRMGIQDIKKEDVTLFNGTFIVLFAISIAILMDSLGARFLQTLIRYAMSQLYPDPLENLDAPLKASNQLLATRIEQVNTGKKWYSRTLYGITAILFLQHLYRVSERVGLTFDARLFLKKAHLSSGLEKVWCGTEIVRNFFPPELDKPNLKQDLGPFYIHYNKKFNEVFVLANCLRHEEFFPTEALERVRELSRAIPPRLQLQYREEFAKQTIQNIKEIVKTPSLPNDLKLIHEYAASDDAPIPTSSSLLFQITFTYLFYSFSHFLASKWYDRSFSKKQVEQLGLLNALVNKKSAWQVMGDNKSLAEFFFLFKNRLSNVDWQFYTKELAGLLAKDSYIVKSNSTHAFAIYLPKLNPTKSEEIRQELSIRHNLHQLIHDQRESLLPFLRTCFSSISTNWQCQVFRKNNRPYAFFTLNLYELAREHREHLLAELVSLFPKSQFKLVDKQLQLTELKLAQFNNLDAKVIATRIKATLPAPLFQYVYEQQPLSPVTHYKKISKATHATTPVAITAPKTPTITTWELADRDVTYITPEPTSPSDSRAILLRNSMSSIAVFAVLSSKILQDFQNNLLDVDYVLLIRTLWQNAHIRGESGSGVKFCEADDFPSIAKIKHATTRFGLYGQQIAKDQNPGTILIEFGEFAARH